MNAVITSVLTLLAAIIPTLNSSGTIAKIIQTLIELVPIIAKEVADVLPMVKNIIAALKENSEITPTQIDELEVLSQQVDEAFETAAAAALAEDAKHNQ